MEPTSSLKSYDVNRASVPICLKLDRCSPNRRHNAKSFLSLLRQQEFWNAFSRLREEWTSGFALLTDLCRYRDRPFAFLARYVRRRAFAHAVILLAVLAAVTCSVSTQ